MIISFALVGISSKSLPGGRDGYFIVRDGDIGHRVPFFRCMEYSGKIFIYLVKDVLRQFLAAHRDAEQLEGRFAIYYLDTEFNDRLLSLDLSGKHDLAGL